MANAEQQSAWASYCQKCNSQELQIVTESTVSGGHGGLKACFGFLLFGPIGLLCGNKKVKTDHKSFWVCSKCGNKFRMLTEVIDETRASRNGALTSAIIWAVISIILFIVLPSEVYAFAVIGLIVVAVQGLLFFLRNKDLTMLTRRNEEISAGLASINQAGNQQQQQ